MYWLSVIYFFTASLLAGTIIDLFVRDWKADWLEKLVMRFGVGLAMLSVIGIVLDLFRIWLDYRIFLLVGFLIFSAAFWWNKRLAKVDLATVKKRLKSPFWKEKRFWYAIIVLVLFVITAHMYLGGSSGYGWFEDSDPWYYTYVSAHIGHEKSFAFDYKIDQYGEPYTQGYQVVMGTLMQTNPSPYWTMKFFHNLILAFSVLFFYYFARRFTKSEEAGLLAAFFLFAVPSWVSHFIFSLGYNMVIFTVFLYALAMLREESESKKTRLVGPFPPWTWIAMLVMGSLWINHFSTAIMASLLFILYWVDAAIIDAKLHEELLAIGIGGFLISLLMYIPMFARHWDLTTAKFGFGGLEQLFPLMHFLVSVPGIIVLLVLIAALTAAYHWRTAWFAPIAKYLLATKRKLSTCIGLSAIAIVILILPVKLLSVLGSGTRDYTLKDFFIATSLNAINNPVGIGLVLMILFLLGIVLAVLNLKRILQPKHFWVAVSLTWAIATLLLVNGTRLSITLLPFRFWPFLAIAVALMAAFGTVKLLENFKGRTALIIGLLLVAALVIPTSFVQKHEYNTVIWPDHEIMVSESRNLYEWMRDTIPKGSNVLSYCLPAQLLVAYDASVTPISNREVNPGYFKDGYTPWIGYSLDQSLEENKAFLRKHDIQYVSIGATCVVKKPPEEQQAWAEKVQTRIMEIANDPSFELVHNTDTELLFKFHG